MRKTLGLACAAVLLTLGACSGDDGGNGGDGGGGGGGDSAAEAQARESIKTGVLEGGSDVAVGLELTEEQAECFADGMVDELGVDKLQQYGILTEDNELAENTQVDDMSAEDADEAAGVVTDCVDVRELLRESLAEGTGGELTEEQTSCVLDAVDEDVLEDALAAQLQGEGATNPLQGVMGEVQGCLTGTTP